MFILVLLALVLSGSGGSPQQAASPPQGGPQPPAPKTLAEAGRKPAAAQPDSLGQQPFGPSIQFDTKGVDFNRWIRKFKAQVYRNWFVPEAAMSLHGHVVLTFLVHKDGALTDVRVIQPSAVDSFNLAAFSALTVSNPTQPLPPEYPSETCFFTVTFYYSEKLPDFGESSPRRTAITDANSVTGMTADQLTAALGPPAETIVGPEGTDWVYKTPDGAAHIYFWGAHALLDGPPNLHHDHATPSSDPRTLKREAIAQERSGNLHEALARAVECLSRETRDSGCLDARKRIASEYEQQTLEFLKSSGDLRERLLRGMAFLELAQSGAVGSTTADIRRQFAANNAQILNAILKAASPR